MTYSRLIAPQSRATDEVHALLLSYSRLHQMEGITLRELLTDYSEQLKSTDTVIAAVNLLAEESKVVYKKSRGHSDPRNSIRIYPQPFTEPYHGYAIEVLVRRLEDGAFNAYGVIRKAHSALTGLPFECPFDTHGERHASAVSALEAGIGFAKRTIGDK
jgi:hypothetical protein